MSLEVEAIQRLAKGMRLRPVFSPKKGSNKPKGNKGKDTNKKDNKSEVSTDTTQTKSKKESSVGSVVKSNVSNTKSNIPSDMKPSPIGLSNTSSLPAVNLGGMGTRSKQFKGQ